MEWSRCEVEWSGVEWSGVEWSGCEVWSGIGFGCGEVGWLGLWLWLWLAWGVVGVGCVW